MLPDKEDHVEIALSRLKSVRRLPVIEGLITSWLVKLQDVEDSAEFYKNVSIYNAVGGDLDRIGALFNIPRLAKADDDYRVDILAFIAASAPQCSIEGIINATKAYGNTDQVDLHEHFPAYVQMYMGDGFDPDMHSVVKTMVGAGIGTSVLVDDNGDSIVFAEESPVSNVLVNENDEIYEMEYEEGLFKNLSVSTIGATIEYFDGLSILSEEAEDLSVEDDEFNPFAEELYRKVLYEVGEIVDESGNFLVDEFGNKIIYIDFRVLT